jgi:hypothetical protein
MASNGEAERPRAGARLEPRAHTSFGRPRRHYRASRPAPAIVRGTATAAKRSHPVHLVLLHRAHARSSDIERSEPMNEAADAECSHGRSGATPAPAATTGTVITPTAHEAVQLGRRSSRANRRGNEGIFQQEKMRRRQIPQLSRTVPLTVKLRGRAPAPGWSRGCTLSSSTRGDTTDSHGTLQRLLCGARTEDEYENNREPNNTADVGACNLQRL